MPELGNRVANAAPRRMREADQKKKTMRIIHWALVACAASWFIAGAWWMGHRNGCDCGTTQSHAQMKTMPAVTQLGPAAAAIASTAVEAPVATPHPALATPLTIRFSKNAGGPELTTEDQAWISVAAGWLSGDGASSLIIAGHTDADGDSMVNQRLSLVRAEQVRALLVEAGLPADRLRTIGVGASRPLADNLTSRGKALNRRVEVALASESDSTAQQ